ncbi:MAG TPA: hypothetical protein VGS02_04915 [Acidobacteriaceae bacterium]|nr:hypothetical protein [Acidobacteriaceae bacterium]
MNRIAPGRTALVLSCLLTLPILTFAQSAPHAQAISDVLPDAPAPQNTEPTRPAPQSQQQTPPSSTQSQQPAPQQNPNQPSLGDLGFTPQQTQANAQLQKRLNERTHDLKVHQTLGIITLAPMAAAVFTSGGAKQKRDRSNPGAPRAGPSNSGVDLHVAFGSATVVMYAATAYYAIHAPKIAGVKPRGAIRLHRDLVWIHAPGMVLTPILGAMALNQENQGQKVHGIASAHAAVAAVTITAYAASMLAVSWPIHLKFWEKK